MPRPQSVLVQNRLGIGHHGRDATICTGGRALFRGRHFDQEIVVLNVRWYVTYKLSYRDLVAMMGERGIDVAHTTILRWVQHYTPEFQKRLEPLYTDRGRLLEDGRNVRAGKRPVDLFISRLYRAVDKQGQTVDFYLSRKRDVNAAKTFLRKAIKHRRVPTKLTLDASTPPTHRAVADLKQSRELPQIAAASEKCAAVST